MTIEETELSKAIKVLTEHLKKDKDYFYSWQSNIAMQFKDEVSRQSPVNGYCALVHEIANTSAVNFLQLLCRDIEGEEK
jgi:hypothetical protein